MNLNVPKIIRLFNLTSLPLRAREGLVLLCLITAGCLLAETLAEAPSGTSAETVFSLTQADVILARLANEDSRIRNDSLYQLQKAWDVSEISKSQLIWAGVHLSKKNLDYLQRHVLESLVCNLNQAQQTIVYQQVPIKPFSGQLLNSAFSDALSPDPEVRMYTQYVLKILAQNPSWASPIWHKSTELLNSGLESLDDFLYLQLLESTGRYYAQAAILPASKEEIENGVDKYLSSVGPINSEKVSVYKPVVKFTRAEAAQRENALFELLCNESNVKQAMQYVDSVQSKLKQSKQNNSTVDLTKLEYLKNYLRPGLASEFWTNGLHFSTQYMIVGVPQENVGALRASHFDSVSDTIAHCVSGNNLSPGNHDVGIAIKHPNTAAFFYLVNLPTPKRKLLYEDKKRIFQQNRLEIITRQTLDFYKKQPELSDPQIAVLDQLDFKQLTDFFNWYVFSKEDQLFFHSPMYFSGEVAISHHEYLAVLLGLGGTAASIESIQKAIAQKRFYVHQTTTQNFPVMAILELLEKFPCKKNRELLEQYALSEAPIIIYQSEKDLTEITQRKMTFAPIITPEIGATALAILARQSGIAPESLGLEFYPQSIVKIELSLWCFPSASSAEQVYQQYKQLTERMK